MPLTPWFHKHQFTAVTFQDGLAWVVTSSQDNYFTYKLRERPGYTTWYREATGGSLIVFEVMIDRYGVKYDGYCPLLLFGIWERKLSFKPNAGWLTCYRKEGWLLEQALKEEVRRVFG